jgi:hypothetical protein
LQRQLQQQAQQLGYRRQWLQHLMQQPQRQMNHFSQQQQQHLQRQSQEFDLHRQKLQHC